MVRGFHDFRLPVAALLLALTHNAFSQLPQGDISAIDRLTPFNGFPLSRNPDGVALTSAREKEAKALTSDRFSIPLIISARARADSSSIRLCYGHRGEVILNWEDNESELVYLDPKTGQKTGVAGQGTVPKNAWVNIRWTIGKEQSTLEVDGKQRGLFHGDYAGMSAPVGIATYGGGSIAIASLSVGHPDLDPVGNQPPPPDPYHMIVRPPPNATPMFGPTTRVANPQSSIRIPWVMYQGDKPIGGRTTDLILTLDASNNPQLVTVHFITPIGDQTVEAVNDVLRYIHLKFPNWYAHKAELTFADRDPHDDVSISAAVGTLILGSIEGIPIDPEATMTGNVVANGSIRAVGGVSFRVRGAASGGCSILAVPMRNYDNLIDSVIYKGPSVVSDIQIIGTTNLEDAIAVVRSDREKNLAQAIVLFDEVKQTLKDNPDALYTPKMQGQLASILGLAPRHLSAKLLLIASQKKLPKTLSATASLYYTNVAVNVMLPILKDRENFDPKHQITSSAVQQQLANLTRLRPISDAKIQPLIDAWSRYLHVWSDAQSSHGSGSGAEVAYQKLLDEQAKVDDDPELNQKLLNEGM